jgi:hypothetical protein
MRAQFDFLDSRTGADDSDVEALVAKFRITETEAAVVYCAWLDSLSAEREAAA